MNTLILSPLLGVVVKLLVSWFRANPNIPWLTESHKRKVLAVAGILSALAGVVTAAMDGSLDEGMVNALIEAIGIAAPTFATAVTLHEVTKKQ